MDDKQRLQLSNMIKANNVEDQTGLIRQLKHSQILRDEINNMIVLKSKYKGDDDPNFDYSLYEDAINQLRKELNKDNVKKALSSVLRNDILNNIEMKLTCSVTEKKNNEKKGVKN